MKLQTLKPHFFGVIFKRVGEVYMADMVHGGIVVRSGCCKELKLPTRKDKIQNKQHPKTRKKAIQTKKKK